tara:strand:+ start:1175 stop:1360 length:186 start_codon:yes stop_codon:yes gene_type:complete
METTKDNIKPVTSMKDINENRPLYYITVSGMVGRIERPTVTEVARVHQENKAIKGLENNDT